MDPSDVSTDLINDNKCVLFVTISYFYLLECVELSVPHP